MHGCKAVAIKDLSILLNFFHVLSLMMSLRNLCYFCIIANIDFIMQNQVCKRTLGFSSHYCEDFNM